MASWFTGAPEEREKWRRVYRKSGVGLRHSVIDAEQVFAGASLEARNAFYAEMFIQLGAQAVSKVLSAAGWRPSEFHTFITVSCTGFMIPSVEAYISNLLGFPRSIRRLPITELGCAAGAMGLGFAADLVEAHRAEGEGQRSSTSARGGGGKPPDKALLLAAEFPSLNFQVGDRSPAQLVSSALFGDGVAAVVVGPEPERDGPDPERGLRPGPRIRARRSHLFPDSHRYMGFDLRSSGFHIILAREIPELVRGSLAGLVGAFLDDLGWRKEEVRWWILHPGGEKILLGIAEVLALPAERLEPSRRVLQEWGNTSSAAVLLVLDRVLPQAGDGDRGLLLAFGPGFSVEMAALEW